MAIVLDGTNGVTTNSGTVISASTIGVGGATPSTSGAGITFPATQSASSDANTLDDYEEGTWTPSLSGAGGTAGSYAQSAQSGNYIKIGKLVWVWGSVAISNKGSWSSSVYFTLPFTPEGQVQGTGAVRSQLHTFSGTLVCEYSTSGSFGRFNVTSSGGGQTNLDWSAISQTAGNYLSFSLVYQQA
jgi:hypothetical protein